MNTATSRSLASLLVVLIVTTVSILLAAVGALAYRAFSQDEHRSFNEAMELAADQLSVSLAPAAWNLEYEQVRKLMDSHMRNQAIQAVEVELDTARFALTRDADWTVRPADGPIPADGLRLSERPVMFGDQEVGHIRQYGSTRFVDEKLGSTLVTLVLFIVLLDVVLTLALYVAIQRMVVQPLRRVERYADEVAREGRSDTALGDLGFLGELQRLTRSIDAMVGQLGARNAELARSNERFQRVIRLMPLPISLFDRDGRIVFLNDQFVDTFGYTLEDIPDAHTWFRLAYPDPAYRSEVLQTWSRELEASGQSAGLVRPLRYLVTCKDGQRKVVEIGGMMSEDPNISVLNDITERTRAEEELARHRDKLEELVASRTAALEAANHQLEETQFALDHSGVAIQWIDAGTGRFTYVNDHACTLYGLSREGLIGMPAGRVLPGLSVDHLKALAPSAHETGQTRMETEIHRGDGRTIPIEIGLYFNPRTPDGNSHCIAFCIDITQRREAEQALIAAKQAAESAAQARSEFLANMSHEIRTPMNAVIGMTRLALQTELDAKQRNYVAKANGSAVALLGILNDILDFSKVEAGHIALESVPFRLDRVFESVMSVVSLRAEEKGLDLLIDIDPGVPPAVVGDPLRLGQILTNLAGNAIKFTEQGEVIIGCRVLSGDAASATLEFSVRDTGIGMNADQLAGLFRPFTQGDASISRRFGGTGLGLAISRRLAQLMGGTLQARSIVAIGSTFTLTVRFDVADLPDGARPELPDALRNRRVLVVDDNPEALQILCRDLEHLGLNAERAASGAAALDMLAKRPSYALMVCDWKMPGMDGIELIRAVQSSRTLAHPPAVIMVSAYDSEDLHRASSGLNLAGVLTKPANASTLHDAVVTALGETLPVTGRPSVAVPPDAARIHESLNGRSVLVVEDNPVNQELAVEILTGVGMQVTVANDGAQALEQLDRRDFDCVLMDVQMPVMDGLEATRRIRSRERLRTLPVIAMTAGAMSWEREQTREAGMNDHVTKPVDVDELMGTLVHWLGGRAPVPRVQPDAAPSSPLLDTAAALRAVNGATATYHRILGVFENNTRELLDTLRRAQVADPAEMARVAHRGRGGAGAVGARALSAALETLERACLASDETAVAAAMSALEPVLAATLERVRQEIATDTADAPPLADLARLRELLVSNDSEALDVMAGLRGRPLAPATRQALQMMGRAVDRYDFDQALQQLDQLQASMTAGVSAGDSPNRPSDASPRPGPG